MSDSGYLKLGGEESRNTLVEANNYAKSLKDLERLEEAKALLRKTIPVAGRVLGDKDRLTLTMRWIYAEALCRDSNATLDDLCEAVTTLEEIEPIARRVLGGAHPLTRGLERYLQYAQATLRAREAGKRVVFEYK